MSFCINNFCRRGAPIRPKSNKSDAGSSLAAFLKEANNQGMKAACTLADNVQIMESYWLDEKWKPKETICRLLDRQDEYHRPAGLAKGGE